MKKWIDEVKNELLQDEDIALICQYIFAPSYWIKKVNMMFWVKLHVLTRHKVVRSFEDLFYSPNGFDLHSVIVICCLVAIAWGLYDDFKILRKMIGSSINMMKNSMDEIRNMEKDI